MSNMEITTGAPNTAVMVLIESSVGANSLRAKRSQSRQKDAPVKKQAGMSIPEIFRLEGEEGFRRRETEILRELGKRSGIILSTATKEKPEVFEVVSAGPGGVVDGNVIEMVVKAGDRVVTSKYSGTEVKLDGEEYVIVRQSDILAIVE